MLVWVPSPCVATSSPLEARLQNVDQDFVWYKAQGRHQDLHAQWLKKPINIIIILLIIMIANIINM